MGAMSGSLRKNKNKSKSFSVAEGGTGYETKMPTLPPKKLATDKASPQELASAKKEAVEGGMTKGVANGIFKDMGNSALYKKYCKR